MSDEAHISAEPSGPQTASRVPLPDGDEERPQDPERAAAPGAEKALGLIPLETLKKRRDFLAAAKAFRAARPGLHAQARRRRAEDAGGDVPRIGFTCSKKVGGAVDRNRAKRRLREAARLALTPVARPGWDYVLIGRREATAARPFPDLLNDVAAAVAAMHAAHDKPRSRS